MLKKTIYNILFRFSGFFLIGLALYANKYFGKITLDQALTTIAFNTQGAIEGNASFFHRFIEWCVLWPAILALVVTLVPALVRAVRQLMPNVALGTRLLHFTVKHFNMLLLMTGVTLVTYQYSLVSYASQYLHGRQDYFAVNYVNPEFVKITATKKTKSLVLIYVESLEDTYEDPHLFQRNLLQQLTSVKANHISFDHFEQMPGTQWSMAGIVATQCGVPLKLVTIFGDNRTGENIKQILPNAMCLGDILAAKGYKNIYLNGSALSFAGVGKFLSDHHYTEMIGRDEWLARGVVRPEQLTSWGLPDDLLFAQAKRELAQLIKQDKLFNLTIFTIDTHGVNGQLSKTCREAGYHDFEGIVECTANQTAAFIDYIKEQGWLDKVNVVVTGDHLAMKNLVYNKLTSVDPRYIFNMLVSATPLQKNTNVMDHFDMLPTMLTSLGFNIEGGRLGLGYSAVGDHAMSPPESRMSEMRANIAMNSPTYNRLWVNN